MDELEVTRAGLSVTRQCRIAARADAASATIQSVAVYRFEMHIAAPREIVFDLWTNLDRMAEWVGGVTKVTNVTGPTDQAGTHYTVWYGRMASPSEILEADRPRYLRTKFGSRLLRGQTSLSLEPEGEGTSLTQLLRTEGFISALAARIFASGSYSGSFRGELEAFVRLAEREAQRTADG